MTQKVADRIRQGLNEAIEFAEGKAKRSAYGSHELGPIDVKAIRRKTNLSQQAFARWFGISAPTLRHWERGDRRPRGPARVLLTLIAHAPDMVLKTLQAAHEARTR